MDERVDALRENIVLFNRRIRTKSTTHRLTPTQIQALAHLDRIGPMTARELADVEMVTPQTVARTVASLEQQNLVTRATDPTDARASIITVTAAGHDTLEHDRYTRSEWLADAIDRRCTDVERELLFLAGDLLRRLASETDPPTPTSPVRATAGRGAHEQ